MPSRRVMLAGRKPYKVQVYDGERKLASWTRYSPSINHARRSGLEAARREYPAASRLHIKVEAA